MLTKKLFLIVLLPCSLFFCGCSPTSAPTEAVTNTLDNTVNGTLDLSSSSTPGASDSARLQVETFTRANYADLQREMAMGQGEHLDALRVLLAISPSNEARFNALVQDNYPRLFPRPKTPPQFMVAQLYQTLGQSPIGH